MSKIKGHLALALTFFLLTLIQQYSFYWAKGLPIIWLPFGKYIAIFVLLFLLTFAKGNKTRFTLLSFVMLLNFFQMAHLSYYGTQILPIEIYLLFKEAGEVGGTLSHELHHVFIPLIFTIIPLLVGHFIQKRVQQFRGHIAVTILFLLYFAYNPIRTSVTGNTWGRQPSNRELTGMNVYLSLSYFLGKILPQKLLSERYSLEQNESLKLTVKAVKPNWDKVIIVLGESLTPNHMSLFGYSEPTTPFLETLKDDDNFYFARALSTGVSTDISVAFFLNLGYGDAGAIKAAKGEHCLFRKAKEAGFGTHFISIQSEQQLRYISPYLCSSYLDDFRGMETVAPNTVDHQAALDTDLIPSLRPLLQKTGPEFIMLHQRGSHAPWSSRYVKATATMNKNSNQNVNDYDNSVVEFDRFWKQLTEALKESKEKILLVYLSDHGESLGEEGRWGHGFIKPAAFEIPVLIQSFNQELPKVTRNLPANFTQYNLALYILNEIGWETNQRPQTILKDFVIFGNDIDGLAGKARVKYGILNEYRFENIP